MTSQVTEPLEYPKDLEQIPATSSQAFGCMAPQLVPWFKYTLQQLTSLLAIVTKQNVQILSNQQALLQGQAKMDASVTQLQTDIATLKTDVNTKLTSMAAQIATLTAAVGQMPTDAQAALQQLDADVKGLDATVNPPAAAPAKKK